MIKQLYCDFCRSTDPLVKDYEAAKYIEGTMPDGTLFIDDGIWASCGECSALIEAKKFDELFERVVAGTLACWPCEKDTPELREKLRFMLRAVLPDA